ncbi:MAG: membrane protein insertion efficiency factor YidD [Spirochaetaceae bacterium]|nr:membrane protein insertion efficiency factor YidD [Spirochaetaceae bacterium]
MKLNQILVRFFCTCIRVYQKTLSPLLGQNKCRFYPTCSNYALESLKKYGILKGMWLALKRILRCNPFCKGGYDPVP